jgi:hypothetical protein
MPRGVYFILKSAPVVLYAPVSTMVLTVIMHPQAPADKVWSPDRFAGLEQGADMLAGCWRAHAASDASGRLCCSQSHSEPGCA